VLLLLLLLVCRTRRLDFSYFEFNLPNFSTVLEGCWDFHKHFKAQHGFAPRGYGIYFVNRGYAGSPSSTPRGSPKASSALGVVGVEQLQQQQYGDVLAKPYGNYSQWGPGVSFMMDPITDDADSPLVRADGGGRTGVGCVWGGGEGEGRFWWREGERRGAQCL
jgi:hypothetical protein